MFTNFRPTAKHFLFAYILLNLVLGLFIVDDFGISADEGFENRRSGIAFSIYTNQLETDALSVYSEIGVDKYYGTAAVAIGVAAKSILTPLFDLPAYVYQHYVYFLFFLAGLVALYFLAAMFMPEWYALGITILFGTQPLFFGHAFINPKDIPLLSNFLAAVTAGFYAVDQLSKAAPAPHTKQSSRKEKILVGLAIFALLIPILKNLLYPLADWVITYAYQAPETNLAHRIFKSFTTYGSLEGYLILGRAGVNKILPWMAALIAANTIYFTYQVWRNKFFGRWVTFPILLAGGLWGYAISTRVIALAAGGIVGVYALITLGKKAVPYLVSYTLTAAAISYISWPYLWYLGIQGFLDALQTISNFPMKYHVLFEGQVYAYNEIPFWFLPKLMLLQFTEPVTLLMAAGMLLSIYGLIQKKLDWKKTVLLYAWFALPLIYTIARGTVTYNNFRQYFFILPPLFIFAGLALHAGLSQLKGTAWKIAVGAVLLLPGLIAIIQLHPYEYVYYNQFVGGVRGAYRQYELDYWRIANKEIAEYIDANIPPGSSIMELTFNSWLNQYVENSYTYVNMYRVPEDEYANYDYAIVPTFNLFDLQYLPDQEIVYQVERDDAVLMVLKKLK